MMGAWNYYLECRIADCRKEVEGDFHFCDAHAAYRPLSGELFGDGGKKRTVNHTEPFTAVYIIGCRRTDAIKIGIATDVMGRIAQLQTGYPFPLKLYGAFYTKRKWAEKIERDCHAKLKEFGLHLHGEWFEAEPDDGVRLVAKMAEASERPVLTVGQYGSMLGLWDDIKHDVHDNLWPVRSKIKRDWLKELLDIQENSDKSHL